MRRRWTRSGAVSLGQAEASGRAEVGGEEAGSCRAGVGCEEGVPLVVVAAYPVEGAGGVVAVKGEAGISLEVDGVGVAGRQ